MNTYLLTWNPDNWDWVNIDESIDYFRKHGFLEDRWSTGVTKSIKKNDRFFLIKLGREPRGIFGSGWIDGASFEDRHWNGEKGKKALYVPIIFDALINPYEKIFPLSILKRRPFKNVYWTPQASGMLIPEAISDQLEKAWRSYLKLPRLIKPAIYAEDDSDEDTEGKKRTVSLSYYERSAWARARCINHFGTNCSVCNTSFGMVYGKAGKGYIHVHHLVPMAVRKSKYVINAIRDLRPICPNCHAMLHQRNPIYTIEEIKIMLKRNVKRN